MGFEKILKCIDVVGEQKQVSGDLGGLLLKIESEKLLLESYKNWPILKVLRKITSRLENGGEGLVYILLLNKMLKRCIEAELKVVGEQGVGQRDGFGVTVQKLVNTKFRVTAVSRKRFVQTAEEIRKLSGVSFKEYKGKRSLKISKIKIKKKRR